VIAIAVFFLSVHPDFYLSDEEFDEKYLSTAIEHLRQMWFMLPSIDKEITLTPDPILRARWERTREYVCEEIESHTELFLQERRDARRRFLTDSGSIPIASKR
jgi:hypothetical protein